MRFRLSSTLERPRRPTTLTSLHLRYWSPIHIRNGALSKWCVFKTPLCRTFGKPPFPSAFSIPLVWTRGENASESIPFHTIAGKFGRGLSWAHDSHKPGEAYVAPRRNLQAHSPALTSLYLRYWCWIKMAASISCCCWWRLVCRRKEWEHKLTVNKHKKELANNNKNARVFFTL